MNAMCAKDILLHPQSSDSSDIREATEYAIKAIDKQIAIKPIAPNSKMWQYQCPICGVRTITPYHEHCHRCGQALDWSDIE